MTAVAVMRSSSMKSGGDESGGEERRRGALAAAMSSGGAEEWRRGTAARCGGGDVVEKRWPDTRRSAPERKGLATMRPLNDDGVYMYRTRVPGRKCPFLGVRVFALTPDG